MLVSTPPPMITDMIGTDANSEALQTIDEQIDTLTWQALGDGIWTISTNDGKEAGYIKNLAIEIYVKMFNIMLTGRRPRKFAGYGR